MGYASVLDLTSPTDLKALLARHGIDARKGLGQHFLVSRPVVDKVVAAIGEVGGVLEIGPGPGVITAEVSGRIPTTVIELDARMASVLAESAPNARVVQQDALAVNLAALLGDLPAPRAVVSNLPYYITGPLVARIADARTLISRAVLMMQREVADRFIAPVGDSGRGAVSVILQRQFTIKMVCRVPGGCFMPPPKVESAVLLLTPREDAASAKWEQVVRAGFKQPRKTLSNNLRASGFDSSIIAAVGLEPNARPHFLTEEQWDALAAAIP